MVLMVLSLCLLIKYNLASCLTKIPASKQFRVKSLDNCMNFLLHLQIMRVLGPTKHTLNGFVMQLQKLGIEKFQFSSVQSLSHIQLLATSWTAALQASLSITNSQNSLELLSIELVMPINCLILCHSLLLLPSIFPSIRVFTNESVLHFRWPKYWSFRFSIRPFNEHPGLISCRMDWLDLFAVQGILKSLLQEHSSKASILQHSAFFMVQLSHPYMTTGKTIALTRWAFVGKVMSLFF